MCGIVGIVSAYKNGFSQPEVDAFGRMLFLDTLRGWDSTGVFAADKGSNVLMMKKAVDGPTFMRQDEFKTFNSKLIAHARFAVGHNRAATRGTIKDENAHPFCVDDKIVLVQNGTWFGDHKHIKNTEVDTEAIAHLIATEPDIEEALSKVRAAYALVWYNVEQNSLNFIRNDHRPLYVADMASGAFLFASEEETITYVAGKNNWKFKKHLPYLLKPNNLFTFKFNNQGDVVECTNKEIKDKIVAGGHSYYPLALGHHGGNIAENHGAGSTQQLDFTLSDVMDDESFIVTGETNTISQAVFHHMREHKGNVNLELIQYYPANIRDDCDTFFLTGQFIGVESNSPLSQVLIVHTATGISEQAAAGMVKKGFFAARFSGLTRYSVTGGAIIALRVNAIRPLITVVDEGCA